jgi:hypothetical protein
MPNDLEEMELVPDSAERILGALVPAWTKRCEKLLIKGEREFCFVWRAKEDGLRGSGMLCRRHMVREAFGDDMGEAIEQLIDQADHVTQVVGILIFGEKGYGFTAQKVGDLELKGPQILN